MANAKVVLAASPGTHIPGPQIPGSVGELTVIGFIIVVALYFGQVVFVPLALAIILAFVLAPPVRVLRRFGLGNTPAVFLVVGVAFAIIFGVGALITQQVSSLANELPRYQLTLTDKVKSIKSVAAGSGGAIERASATLKDLQKELQKRETATTDPVSPLGGGAALQRQSGPVPVEVRAPEPTPIDQLQGVIAVVLAPLATTGVVLLFVLFLLLQREDVRDRAIRLLGSHDLEKSTAAMDDAGERLGRYFLALTGINAAFGIVIGCGLWLIGVPSPVLWGVLAMLMRFVPFVGSFIAAAFPLLLAAAVDPGWTMFLWTLALYLVSEPIMGNVIEPVIQGQRTGLTPLAIVLSAAFWTLLWGPIGLLLAIPLTVVLVVLGRHVERLEFLHVMLGDTPPLSPAERFYQRMLARDPGEAVEQAEKFIKDHTLVDYYDDVVVEGLRLAQADVDRDALDVERLPELRGTAEIVIDTLSDHDLAPKKKRKAPAATNGREERRSKPSKVEDDEDSIDLVALAASRSIPPEWQHRNAVLCVASRTALDEAVALVLAQLLTKCGIGANVLAVEESKHGALRQEDLEGVRLICISALDVRERSAHARFLVRRLRRSAPDALLLGGFWKLDPDDDHDKAIIDSVAIDASAHSLRQALILCLQTAQAEGLDEIVDVPRESVATMAVS